MFSRKELHSNGCPVGRPRNNALDLPDPGEGKAKPVCKGEAVVIILESYIVKMSCIHVDTRTSPIRFLRLDQTGKTPGTVIAWIAPVGAWSAAGA